MNYTTRDKSLEGKKVPWLSGLPPEVWTMIAQHIHNRRTQIALRHLAARRDHRDGKLCYKDRRGNTQAPILQVNPSLLMSDIR
ncbi:hypothetical protein M7I_7201 [Glarea lozoyensis 74030]|uniref:Uncharacterized protein n=1 Tax=Glarea lozoyensis (strain ATCC 74030 / MF5533) TaxID=1104152 RepID=H0EWN0_GLAL7|nr:hypothetical protein M7I_7201 [Glarea lozoyensis 74030]